MRVGRLVGALLCVGAQLACGGNSSGNNGDGSSSGGGNAGPRAPSGLTYAANPVAYTKGFAIAPNAPASAGGAVESYAISPALPAGLSLDSATGVISGLPTAVAPDATYVVTATNSVGSTSANVSIAVTTDTVGGGLFHSCALKNGGVKCWGFNNHGQLGNNSTTDSNVPVDVVGLTSNVQAIAGGHYHTCALVSGGVKCWGDNYYGELGDSSNTESHMPVQVTGLTTGVQAIAAGMFTSCAVVSGAVKCWGEDTNGQLGNGSTNHCNAPVAVTGLTSNAQSVSVGWGQACAVVSGAVKCWGINTYGQLGNNSTIESHVPVDVEGLTSNATHVAAGRDFSCAIVSGGARCWGENAAGELGMGSTTPIESHVPLASSLLASGVQKIERINWGACALVNGGVKCWGSNGAGQLGDGTQVGHDVPVSVSGLGSGVQMLGAGAGYHACALMNGGGVKCWGGVLYPHGQLGNGSTAGSATPVDVSGL
jgi:alpha-tubulin suppressor-like RCC1 family protein